LIDLATAKAILQTNRTPLLSKRASTSQIAAARAIQNLIASASKHQTEWAVLRLNALYVLGTYLLRVPRLKQGRPPKNVRGGRFLSLKEHGVDDRRIASRAIKVAQIPEAVFRRYLETEQEPTEKGLHRFACLKGSHQHGYFLTPPEHLEKLRSEFGDLWDACPFPRDPDFDCLKVDWPERVYLNGPWFGNHMDFIKKAVEQIKPGGVIVIVVPIRPSLNYL
jgi:hypothetical protein